MARRNRICIMLYVFMTAMLAYAPLVWAAEKEGGFDLLSMAGALIAVVLIPIATMIGRLIGKLLNKSIAKIDNEQLQSMAWVAVRFAQKKLKDKAGSEKFEAAYEYLAKKLPGVNGDDIEKAIEAAVNSLDLELGNAAGSPSK